MKHFKKFKNNTELETYKKYNFITPHIWFNNEQKKIDYMNKKYQTLEYISSTATGGQYIDLGLQMWKTAPISYKLDMQVYMIGKGKDNHYQCTLFSNNYEASPWPGFVIRNNGDSNIKQDQFPTKIYGTNNTILNIFEEQTNLNVTTHNVTCTLFCGKDSSGTPFRFSEARIYYAKIWSQGELARDLIPCLNSKNIAGLYDLVNDVFYPSQGDEQFITGPII